MNTNTAIAIIRNQVIPGTNYRWTIPISGPSICPDRVLYSLAKNNYNLSIENENPFLHEKVMGVIRPTFRAGTVVNGYRIIPFFLSWEFEWIDIHNIGTCECFNNKIIYSVSRYRSNKLIDISIVETYYNPPKVGDTSLSYSSISRISTDNGATWIQNSSSTGYYPIETTTLNCEYEEPNYPALLSYHYDMESMGKTPGFVSELLRTASSEMALSSNNIATTGEVACVIDAVKDLITKGPRKTIARFLSNVPKGYHAMADSWLKYRYVYNTTKSDVQDAMDKLSKSVITGDNSLVHVVRSAGVDGSFSYFVKVKLTNKLQNGVAELHRSLRQYGLAITPYNIWDMIPFSFIVDWFLPIGTSLENLDADFYYHSQFYDINYCEVSELFSKSVVIGNSSFTLSRYNRSVTNSVPTLTWYEENPSRKTVIFRCLDAASLIIG